METTYTTIEDAAAYLRDICREDNVLIAQHNDMDGCVSAAQIAKYLGDKGIGYKISGPKTTGQLDTDFAAELKGYTKVILVDLNFNKLEDYATLLKNCGDHMIIDHHKVEMELPMEVNIFNPSVTEGVNRAASELVYDILTKLENDYQQLFEEYVVAAVYADYRFKESRLLKVPEVAAKYNEEKLKGLSKICEVIDNLEPIKGIEGIIMGTRAILETFTDPYTLLDGKTDTARDVMKYSQMVKDEVQRVVDFADRHAVIDDKNKIMIFNGNRADIKYETIIGTVVSVLGFTHKGYGVVGWVTLKDKNQVKVSLKAGTRDDLDLKRTLDELTKIIPSSFGGGHTGACGMYFDPKHEALFEETLLQGKLHYLKEELDSDKG